MASSDRTEEQLPEVPGLSGGDTPDGSELALTQVISMGQAMGTMGALFVLASLAHLFLGSESPPVWFVALILPVGMAISSRSAHSVSWRIWPNKLVLSGRIGLWPRKREVTLRGPVQLTWTRRGKGASDREQVALFRLELLDAEGATLTLTNMRCTEEELLAIRTRLETVGRHLEGPDQVPEQIPEALRQLQSRVDEPR